MDELLEVVKDCNYAPFESVSSVMQSNSPRRERLLEHIRETKQMYWTLIAKKCKLEMPPHEIKALMDYEIAQTAALSAESRALKLRYGNWTTVRSLISLSCRHSVWHAGQIALTRLD
jgi:hypothetical protein